MPQESKELKLRRLVRSMVAQIHCTYPSLNSAESETYSCMVGIFLEVKENFCYLMADRSLISDGASYTIYLPDGSDMVIGASEFTIPPSPQGLFAGCYIYHDKVPYDITRIAAVQFGEDVIDFDEVHLCGFSDVGVDLALTLKVTDGRVLEASNGFFGHDCGQTKYTGNGAPVFSENGKLVGICTQSLQGVSTALNVSRIKQNLNHIYNGEN